MSCSRLAWRGRELTLLARGFNRNEGHRCLPMLATADPEMLCTAAGETMFEFCFLMAL
jgi:hypothetical protein